MLLSASYDLSAELGDVLGRGALLALHDVEFNALALGQRLEAVALNGGVMNEAILLSVLGGDEAKALGVVEPLYFAGGTHVRYILIQLCRSAVFCGTCPTTVCSRPKWPHFFALKPKRPGNIPGPSAVRW